MNKRPDHAERRRQRVRQPSGTVKAMSHAELSLSIIMPTHNEGRTLLSSIREVLAVEFEHPVELIVVDDGSTDHTSELLANLADRRLVIHRHPTNQGKGAAVRSGLALATGSHFVVFDADSEYRAGDLVPMFDAIGRGEADVVYGSRLFGSNTLYPSFRYAMGNKLTTLAANVLFDACLTDMHTCLKMLPMEVFSSLTITHSGFDLDTEITAELLRRGYRPFEVPVSYVGRTRAEGKKLTWKDGFKCLTVLMQVRSRGRVVCLTTQATYRASMEAVRTEVNGPAQSADLRDRSDVIHVSHVNSAQPRSSWARPASAGATRAFRG